MNKIFQIDNIIYPDIFVLQGIKDFEEIVKIDFENGDLIIHGENEIEIEESFNEFINYITSLINEGLC